MTFGSMRIFRAAFGLLAVLSAVASLPRCAANAAEAPAQAAGTADDVPGPDNSDTVFVRDSPTAWDTFQNGLRMERLKEWSKAADFYQEVLEKYRDRVVPAAHDADNRTIRYASIVGLVQDQLAHWPREGLDAYCARYQTPAAALLTTAGPGDVLTLHRVFDHYFVTDAGRDAGIRLIDTYLEAGEYRAAAGIGQRLLDLHPDLADDAPSIIYRTALAYHFAGDDTGAQRMLADMTARFAGQHGVVRGEEVILADALRNDLARSAPTSADADPGADDSWPMPWGDPSRSRVSNAAGKPGARLYSIPLSKPVYPVTATNPGQNAQTFEQQFAQAVQSGHTIGVMPVADRGELFFQDGQRIYGMSIESGLPLPGWAHSGSGQYVLPNTWGSSRTHPLAVTLTDDSVVAIMGQPDQGMLGNGDAVGETRLVCVDRETGKEKWVTSPSRLPQSVSTLRDVEFGGSALVVGQSVLVIGRAGKQVQFEDCYVLSFDLKTGKYQWSCYIASANLSDPGGIENTSHLAYADGLLFVQTNFGAIAALDPYAATLSWLDVYPTHPSNLEANNPFIPANMNPQPGDGRFPWTCNPVMVSNGLLFTLPAQGKDFLVYEAATGKELKSLSLSTLHDCNTLLGVVGDRVILCGDKDVVCFDWRKADPHNFSEDDFAWTYSLPKPIRGRGFIAQQMLFIPAADRLWWLNLNSGLMVGEHPLHPREWEDGEGPGNVLVTSENVVLAGASSVDVYTDLTIARANLDREIAAAPSDPQPRLRYAELMFASHDANGALQKLDEAVALLGGSTNGPARDRVFTDALRFAVRSSTEDSPTADQEAVKFYDRAAAAAATPQEQVRFHFGRAQLAERMKDASLAVKLYQEILSDEKLRSVVLNDDESPLPRPASARAEKAIAAVKKVDPSAYAPFEQAAADALDEAKDAGSDAPEKLLAVAQIYPNSSVAPLATLAAADAYEAAGNPRLAVQVARELYFKNPDGPQLSRLLETMARNYLEIRDRPDVVTAAAARLAQGAQLPNDPLLEKPLRLPDDRVLEHVHFSEALAELRKYTSQRAARSLPDFHVPIVTWKPGEHIKWPHPFLPAGPQTEIGGIKSLVTPLADFSRTDRIVAWGADGAIHIITPGEGEAPILANPGAGDEPRQCAWLGGNLLTWGSTKLSLFKADGGAPLWTMDVKQLPALDVVAIADAGGAALPPRPVPNNFIIANGPGRIIVRGHGPVIINGGRMRVLGGGVPAFNPPAPAPAGPEQIVQALPVDDRVLLCTSTGRLLCADLASGSIVWQARLGERGIDRMVANDDFTVARVSTDSSVRLVAVDTFSGEIHGSKDFDLQQAPVNMALAADGTLVYTLPDRLCLKNLYTAWPDPSDREIVIQGASAAAFRNGDGGATLPDQLQIAEGRILALADDGAQKVVRIHSLETGSPLPLRFTSQNGNGVVDRVLAAGPSWNVSLRLVGSHLYVFGSNGASSYNLDEPAQTWTSDAIPLRQFNLANAFVGRNFVAAVEVPAPNSDVPPADNAAPPPCTLMLFSRSPISSTDPAECGRLDYVTPCTEAGIVADSWQAMEGGFCYLTGDQKLHFLIGARDAQ